MATRKPVKWYRKVNWTFAAIRVLALLIVIPPFSVSYAHTYQVMIVARLWFGLALLCAALPDLMMMISLVKITMKRPANHRVSYWVTAAFWFGFSASVACNAYATLHEGVPALVVGVALPGCVMLAVEVVRTADKTMAKRKRTATRKAPAKAPVTAVGTSVAGFGALVPATP